MADNKINVTVSANTRKNITVSSTQQSTEITASTDTGRFWAQTSKNWAVSDVIVDNTDYSSKHYAGIAKESAENAQSIEEIVKNDYNTFLEASMTASSELQATKENAITEIESNKINAVDSMNAVKNDAIDSINSTKTTILNDIEFVADGEKQEIQDLADEIKDSGNTVNTAIEAGVERLNSIDALKTTQITNCLLEVPQRIKYTLENGTLTIKAGTVVIVPYGVEDLTAQYPKGATFLNDNFKVYDTQFADGKFFVWAELVNDLSHKQANSSNEARLFSVPIINETSIPFAFNVWTWSGATAPPTTAAYQWYDTANNKCVHTDKTTGNISVPLISLPILIVSSNGTDVFGSVNQVFNGMGYIGSTIWVDKGVKGLKTNGRNADGTLKSEEFVLDGIRLNNTFNANNVFYAIINGSSNLLSRSVKGYTTYDEENNHIYREDGQFKVGCIVANITATTSGITSFEPKYPFRAMDANTPHITETYVNGTSWYRVWSDGWIEQGGIVNIPAYTTSATKKLTVLKNFSDTNYSVFTQMSNGGTSWANVSTNVEGQTASGFDIRCYQASGTGASIKAHNITWYACGY